MQQFSEDIPLKDRVLIEGPNAKGAWSCSFFAFNTEILIQTYEQSTPTEFIQHGFESAVERCRVFEYQLSRHLPESDISRINRAHGEKTSISADTFQVLKASQFYCKKSDGIFDITMGSACKLWDFSKEIMPDPVELEIALSHVDWRALQLDETEGTYWAQLTDPNASLDVGGVAKGFIADDLQHLLMHEGFYSGIVNLGGNVVTFGDKPDGSPWTIGIRNPAAPASLIGAVPLAEGSVVTSGLYERCFIKDGVRYHHILDPKTGYPVKTDIAGASIVSGKSIDGDGYSTTVFALGSKAALDFVEDLPTIEALLVLDDGTILSTSGLSGFIAL